MANESKEERSSSRFNGQLPPPSPPPSPLSLTAARGPRQRSLKASPRPRPSLPSPPPSPPPGKPQAPSPSMLLPVPNTPTPPPSPPPPPTPPPPPLPLLSLPATTLTRTPPPMPPSSPPPCPPRPPMSAPTRTRTPPPSSPLRTPRPSPSRTPQQLASPSLLLQLPSEGIVTPRPSSVASPRAAEGGHSTPEPRMQHVQCISQLNEPTDGCPSIRLGRMFQDDRLARYVLWNFLLEACNPDDWQHASNNGSCLPSKNRKAHTCVVQRWERKLRQVLEWRPSALSVGTEQSPLTNNWEVDNSEDRFLWTKTGSASFILFMSDFIMGFDEVQNLLALACPLSLPIVQSPEDLSMDERLDVVPEPQVHFIARRLIQLTGMLWKFDCLAKFEQALPGAHRLKKITDLFAGSSIDLEATSLGNLVGCSVGLIPAKRTGAEHVPYVYQVGLIMFGVIFGLSTSDNAIQHPESLDSPNFLYRDEITDFLNMSIGGVHNLCFIPKNEDFTSLQGHRYSSAKTVHDQFMRLGFGSQMSEALSGRAANMILTYGFVTLQETLDSLIRNWRDVSDRSMVPLTFRQNIRRSRFGPGAFYKKGDSFLVLNSGKLFIAKSRKNISKSLTIGLNSTGVQAAAGISMTDKGIITQSEVFSMFDAVAHLHGSQPNFSREGDNWYKPNPPGMSEITGALTLLSVILAGKVKSSGKFMSAVPKPLFPQEYTNESLQSVRFDIPMPYGVVYSTFAEGREPQDEDAPLPIRRFCTIGVERWNPHRNYKYPVIVGGPNNDENVREAIFSVEQQFVPADNANMRGQELFSSLWSSFSS